MPTVPFLQALTERLRKQLEREAKDAPELARHQGFRFDGTGGTIDDGDYGDVDRDNRPAWLKDTDDPGWRPFISFKR